LTLEILLVPQKPQMTFCDRSASAGWSEVQTKNPHEQSDRGLKNTHFRPKFYIHSIFLWFTSYF